MVIGPSTIVVKSKIDTTKRTKAIPKNPKVAPHDPEIFVVGFSIANPHIFGSCAVFAVEVRDEATPHLKVFLTFRIYFPVKPIIEEPAKGTFVVVQFFLSVASTRVRHFGIRSELGWPSTRRRRWS